MALLAGCIGGDQDPVQPEGALAEDGGPAQTSSANITWNVTVWEDESSSVGLYFASVRTDGASRTFQVPENATRLEIEMTETSRDAFLHITPPGCEESDEPAPVGQESCGDFEDDNERNETNPEPGGWLVEVEQGEPGPGTAHFTVEVRIALPDATATG